MTENIKKDDYIVGSAYYMSPQAYNGDPYSLKTDVWSLGVILYTLIYK
jgi:serine/threonine protein kinase